MPATASVMPLHSPDFIELQAVFQSLAAPYGAIDIARFNGAYKPVYDRLSPPERRRAEEFVDVLVAGVERPELARRIYGVV